jgi:hypothetical protein
MCQGIASSFSVRVHRRHPNHGANDKPILDQEAERIKTVGPGGERL